MLLAAHQPNFIPWFPYFVKMHACDTFVILAHCQFEKNGYQNRASVNGRWWTYPVKRGLQPIWEKEYASGENLLSLNLQWITIIARTLGIDTEKIQMDFATEKRGTDRIIELCQSYGADEYLTNPSAMDKYLDADKMRHAGIRVIPFNCSPQKHVFEMFDEYGIEKTRGILNAQVRSNSRLHKQEYISAHR